MIIVESYKRDDFLGKLNIYVHNTNSDIESSKAKPEVKKLLSGAA